MMIRLAKLELAEQRASPHGQRRHSTYIPNQKKKQLSDKYSSIKIDKSHDGLYRLSTHGTDNV